MWVENLPLGTSIDDYRKKRSGAAREIYKHLNNLHVSTLIVLVIILTQMLSSKNFVRIAAFMFQPYERVEQNTSSKACSLNPGCK